MTLDNINSKKHEDGVNNGFIHVPMNVTVHECIRTFETDACGMLMLTYLTACSVSSLSFADFRR